MLILTPAFMMSVFIFHVLLKKDDYVIENSFRNLYCNKLHIKALKYILGVHIHSGNDAILGETGRKP
jgi:hypothetical protein